MNGLTREIIIDILENVIDTKVAISSKAKKNIQFCCSVHGESNPSAGILVEKGIFNCLSCHAKGDIVWLIYKSMTDTFKSTLEVEYFLKNRYGISKEKTLEEFGKMRVKRFEEFKEELLERKEFPLVTLAPFRSGKETYQYFYDRGFTKKTVREFKIGRDTKSKTVTIPVFWEDEKLAGVLGRYIDKNRRKHERYKIYDFKTGDLLFPLNKLEVIDDTIVAVEGILDAVFMHQLGFTNTIATLGNSLSDNQAKIIKNKCSKFIDMFDNDKGGILARKIAREKLGKEVIYYTTEYPEGANDPCECTKEEVEYMLENKRSTLIKTIQRL